MRLRHLVATIAVTGTFALVFGAMMVTGQRGRSVTLEIPHVVGLASVCVLAGFLAAVMACEFRVVSRLLHWIRNGRRRRAFKSADKLMIVAHADDEMIFGGGHLLQSGTWHVLCLTCGDDPLRHAEFASAMKAVGASFEHWAFRQNQCDGWNLESEVAELRHRLRNAIDGRTWSMIATHNPKGEYGHIQHRQLSRMVTDICEDKITHLFYFGDIEMESDADLLPEGVLQHKIETLRLYRSQDFIFGWLGSHFPFEGWRSAAAWARADDGAWASDAVRREARDISGESRAVR